MSSAAHKLIDYLADAVNRPILGVNELIDLDSAIMGGERPVDLIADEFGVHTRTVERRKAELRARGRRVPLPISAFDDECRATAARTARASFTKTGNWSAQ